jgi:hypothetical protein
VNEGKVARVVAYLKEALRTNVFDPLIKSIEEGMVASEWENTIAPALIKIAKGFPTVLGYDEEIRKIWADTLRYIFISLFTQTNMWLSKARIRPAIGLKQVREPLRDVLATIGVFQQKAADFALLNAIVNEPESTPYRRIRVVLAGVNRDLDLGADLTEYTNLGDFLNHSLDSAPPYLVSGLRVRSEAALAGSHVPGHHDDADGGDDDSSSAEYAEPIYPALPLTEGNEGAQVEWNTTVVNIRSPHTRTSVVANKLATLLSLLDSNPALDRERVRRDVASLKGALAAHKSTTIPGLYRQLSERVA